MKFKYEICVWGAELATKKYGLYGCFMEANKLLNAFARGGLLPTLPLWSYGLCIWICLHNTISLSIMYELISINLTLNVRGPSCVGLNRTISWLMMPWLLRRQDISSHDIDYVEYGGLGRTWGRILSTCVISMWSNVNICFTFPLKKLAREGLKQFSPFLLEWLYSNISPRPGCL